MLLKLEGLVMDAVLVLGSSAFAPGIEGDSTDFGDLQGCALAVLKCEPQIFSCTCSSPPTVPEDPDTQLLRT